MRLKSKSGKYTGVHRFDLYLNENDDQEVIDYLNGLSPRRRNEAVRRLIKAALSGTAVKEVVIPRIDTDSNKTRVVHVVKKDQVPSDAGWLDDIESFGIPTLE